MPNDSHNWERTQTSKPTAKQPLEVKWRAAHASNVRERSSKGENPYHREAARDRVIFRWAVVLAILIGLVIYLLFFMAGTPTNGAP